MVGNPNHAQPFAVFQMLVNEDRIQPTQMVVTETQIHISLKNDRAIGAQV